MRLRFFDRWPFSGASQSRRGPADPPPHPAAPPRPAAEARSAEPSTRDSAAPSLAPAGRVGDGTRPIRTILFAVGEPGTPGAILRSAAQAEAARALGLEARVLPLPAIGPADIDGVDLLVLWRAPWSDHLAIMIDLVRAAGARVVLDLDDLMTEPMLADGDLIDAIRWRGFDRDGCARHFAAMRRTAVVADLCLATTDELAAALRPANGRVFVLPNGFGAPGPRPVPRPRSGAPGPVGDGLRRIGWTAGTPTHQRDGATALAAVASLLGTRPVLRLVLFRGEDDGPMVDPAEFAALAPVADRIEWRAVQPLDRLVAEVARFDVAICPLEHGNPYVECKSEMKFVEAALAGVPLIASPTGPFARAIEHGRNGLLAAGTNDWDAALRAVLDDPAYGAALGRAASADAEWRFGPRRRRELLGGLLCRLEGGPAAARETARTLTGGPTPRRIALPSSECLREDRTGNAAAVAVAVTSCNYANLVIEALDSAAAQTLEPLELVVVDDSSTDDSVVRIDAWMATHASRFTRVRLERTRRNSGLGPARNAAFALAEAPLVMVLDADNTLLPPCCETLAAVLDGGDAAFAYGSIRQVGADGALLSAVPFDPLALVGGNLIDAMAMVTRWAWSAAGGYYDRPDARGWEDYDLWCRLIELGFHGQWHPEPLSIYRAHPDSMTNAVTEQPGNKRELVRFMEAEHPWLRLLARDPVPRASLP